jgi:hypothetical protein
MTALLSVLLSLCAFGQSFTGSLRGIITDEKQAVIARAKVTLRNEATGAERNAETSASGEYNFDSLLPGRYSIEVSATGFTAAKRLAEITVAQPLRADVTLGVGVQSETVTVTGEGGVALNTENAELGVTVNNLRILALPSASRNPYDFAAIAPGAARSISPPSFFPRGIGVSVNGQRIASGNYLLDGGQNVNTFIATPGQLIPLDAVQEYRLQTNNFSAEFGRGAGFVANVVTRGGSKDWHGSLYEYNRNSVFAANTPDNNAQGRDAAGREIAPRPVFNRNQFGGALGGPVVKEKAFFFASFESILVRSAAATTFQVPTPELVAISSPGTQAFFRRFPPPSGLSTTNVQVRTLCPFGRDCAAGGRVTIPAFAAFTRIGPTDAGAGNPQNRYLGMGRFDYNINSKMQFFARYAADKLDQFAVVSQPFTPELDQVFFHDHHNALLNLTTTLSPQLSLESRLMYGRVRGPNSKEAPRTGDVPITFFIVEDAILPTGIEGLNYPQNIYQFNQTASWTRGNHTLRFGGQFTQVRDNYTDTFLKTGFMSFFGAQELVNGAIRQYRIAVDPKGEGFSAPINPPFGPPSFTRHFRTNQYALFAHDLWRVTPRLTLGLGLRYENFGVLHSPGDEKRLESNFAFGPGNNIFERIASGAFVRTVDLPGDLKGRLYKPDNNNFAPRASIAYDLTGDGRTVLRAGAGVYFDQVNTQAYIYSYLNPPSFSTTTLSNVQLTSALLQNPYSIFPNAPVTLNASAARFIDPELRAAYVVSWNTSLEREVSPGLIAGASYVGGSGVGLYTNDNLNRTGSGRFLGRPNQRLNQNVSTIQIRTNNGHSSYHALQLRAESHYLERFGVQFGANYTWSHAIDNASAVAGFGDDLDENGDRLNFLDAFNARLDKGSAAFDVRHRFVTSFVWQLPFGKNGDAWRQKLVGGWGVSGILEYQTGQPFTLVDTNAPGFSSEMARPTFKGGALPDYTLRPDANAPNTFLYLPVNAVYNATGSCIGAAAPFGCALNVNGPFTGVLGRNTFRRPGAHNENVSFFKRTPLGWSEGMALEFRAEFYNLFNHPNLILKPGSQNVAALSFNETRTDVTPGVLVTKAGSRQVVLALRLNF